MNLTQKKNLPLDLSERFLFRFRDQNPMQLVAPSAVSTAEIIEARICSDHLSVSFFVIVHLLF